MGDVKQVLKFYQEQINSELDLFFDEKISRVKHISPHALDLMRCLKEFNLRDAKRIRPILLIFGYKCIKPSKNDSELVRAALAAELMESFLLVHDDIIDNDDFRRKKPTLHKVYEKKFEKFKDKADIGKSIALIGGDILATLGSEVLLSTKFKDNLKVKALARFNRVVVNTAFGQVLDVISELDPDISEKDIARIHELKTAKYTIEGPLHIGAILAGANNKQLNKLSAYAIPLGLAFQLQDDILGVFGDASRIGKPVGSDIREGKKTLLILKAMEKSNLKDRFTIKRALGSNSLTKVQIERVRDIIIKSGSLDYSKNLAKQLAERSKSEIKKSKFRSEGKQFLVGIADYIIGRDL
jgi:geranylgeranyl diphosphate synthase type I